MGRLKLSSLFQLKTLRAGFILLIIVHLNLALPVSRASNSGDICIMNNGINLAHHTDNKKIHDHRGDTHHSGHQKRLHEIRVDCNMDMSSSGDIYFPGGEHPFAYNISNTVFYLSGLETVSFMQTEYTEGFTNLPYNPPRFIS